MSRFRISVYTKQQKAFYYSKQRAFYYMKQKAFYHSKQRAFYYKKQKAFTLIEVLVALTIFALCAAVLSAQSTSTLHNRQRLMEHQVALWVARDRLTEMRVNKKLGVAREQVVDVYSEVVQAGMHWDVHSVIESTADKQLKRVTVSVSRQSEAGVEVSSAVQLMAFLAD